MQIILTRLDLKAILEDHFKKLFPPSMHIDVSEVEFNNVRNDDSGMVTVSLSDDACVTLPQDMRMAQAAPKLPVSNEEAIPVEVVEPEPEPEVEPEPEPEVEEVVEPEKDPEPAPPKPSPTPKAKRKPRAKATPKPSAKADPKPEPVIDDQPSDDFVPADPLEDEPVTKPVEPAVDDDDDEPLTFS